MPRAPRPTHQTPSELETSWTTPAKVLLNLGIYSAPPSRYQSVCRALDQFFSLWPEKEVCRLEVHAMSTRIIQQRLLVTGWHESPRAILVTRPHPPVDARRRQPGRLTSRRNPARRHGASPPRRNSLCQFDNDSVSRIEVFALSHDSIIARSACGSQHLLSTLPQFAESSSIQRNVTIAECARNAGCALRGVVLLGARNV